MDTPRIILAQGLPVDSLLARVGALPVLLRAILGAQKAGAARIVVIVDPAAARRVQEELAAYATASRQRRVARAGRGRNRADAARYRTPLKIGSY